VSDPVLVQEAAGCYGRSAGSHRAKAGGSERITKSILHQFYPDLPTLAGFFWPFRGEYDPRPMAGLLHARGVSLGACRYGAEYAVALVFRAWHPDARLVPGVWNVPVSADGEIVRPVASLAPPVGYDQQALRIGYEQLSTMMASNLSAARQPDTSRTTLCRTVATRRR
jgi:hypothetical protein